MLQRELTPLSLARGRESSQRVVTVKELMRIVTAIRLFSAALSQPAIGIAHMSHAVREVRLTGRRSNIGTERNPRVRLLAQRVRMSDAPGRTHRSRVEPAEP